MALHSIGKVSLFPLLGLLSSGLMVVQFRLEIIGSRILTILRVVATQRV
ncbi:MAG: hypothetical protein NWF14_09675 [Candidatus Bathyarchaeota archaeon]|nr:hypothetical protein [Candidatus Bathyarchaeota archaeon]